MDKVEPDNITVSFTDAPRIKQIEATINNWKRPDLPDTLKCSETAPRAKSILSLLRLARERLVITQDNEYKSQLELELINWVYTFIRANVKRGRLFDLNQVIEERFADCLGYAKLFTLFGRLSGLDTGVVEVLTDNAGRIVPHTAVLVILPDRQIRFVDLWYGSQDINHQRVGLRVLRGDSWIVEGINFKEMGSAGEVSYLPDDYVDAITFYIKGNRHLNRQEYAQAIGLYTEAIKLYPGNARLYYNRAIAYENTGDTEKAKADYTQSLSDEASITRILASEHEEVVSLIHLDSMGVNEKNQEVYLLHKGFMTGKKVPLAVVAEKYGLSEVEVSKILSSLEGRSKA